MASILVVDDSKTIRNLLAYILKSKNHKVDTASDGLIALEKVFSSTYDLVITDINMPRMDGFKLIESIREEESYKFLPIIVLTTEAKEEARRLGIKKGANLYLTKPSDPQTLVAYVKMLLASNGGKNPA
jgi:two-component system chemotaxis response regulator CheY